MRFPPISTILAGDDLLPWPKVFPHSSGLHAAGCTDHSPSASIRPSWQRTPVFEILPFPVVFIFSCFTSYPKGYGCVGDHENEAWGEKYSGLAKVRNAKRGW